VARAQRDESKDQSLSREVRAMTASLAITFAARSQIEAMFRDYHCSGPESIRGRSN